MYRLDAAREFLAVDAGAIIALYQSVNTASVSLPGLPAATARAIIAGHRCGDGSFDVTIGLHLPESGRHLVFAHDEGALDRDGARTAAKEALGFVEAMGFFMENVNWKDLDAVAQRELAASMKVFHPPPARVKADVKKVADPRTKLARLLAQF